jgi:hypothetical protein
MTATTNQTKGLNYEIFIKKFLESDHTQTWLWSDIPENELRKSKLLGNWNEHRLVKKDNKINGIPDLGADILLKDNEKLILCLKEIRFFMKIIKMKLNKKLKIIHKNKL